MSGWRWVVQVDSHCVRPCSVDMSSVCVPQDAEALSHCGPPSATCKKNIDWMRSDGLVNHPDWYPGSGLTPASPAAAMQAWLYHRGGEDCALPCGDLSALHLGFDPVRPSWLAPDVDSDPHTICNERVLWQPEKFQQAFWSVKSVKVFQPSGTATTCSDGERNGGEDGVDCGGPCDAACPTGGPSPPCASRSPPHSLRRKRRRRRRRCPARRVQPRRARPSAAATPTTCSRQRCGRWWTTART